MARPGTYRPPPRRSAKVRRALVASVTAVVTAAVLMGLVVRLAAERPDRVDLGDDTFVVGDAARLARRIAEQREPFLFKDPLSSRPGRELYVLHVGTDPEEGWAAVEAYAPGAPRELRCILDWEPARRAFVDPCPDAGDRTEHPAADTSGLVAYPADVDDDGEVVVDLRRRRGA